MRIPFIAGNWKMNKNVEEARALVSEMIPLLEKVKGVEKVICPPFPALLPLAALLIGTDIGLGAQNMHWETSGAFTGEVAPGMVAEFCRYVIVGHSERRLHFGETDSMVNRKILAAIKAGLVPILCVGETLEENEQEKTKQVVHQQVMEGLVGVEAGSAQRMVIAYEPIWAIGTGRAASAENANDVVAHIIRPAMKELFNKQVAEGMRVLYGGSVSSGNAGEFFSQSEIDGALVGGASLRAEEFVAIVRAANRE